jgi:hypothetical protein
LIYKLLFSKQAVKAYISYKFGLTTTTAAAATAISATATTATITAATATITTAATTITATATISAFTAFSALATATATISAFATIIACALAFSACERSEFAFGQYFTFKDPHFNADFAVNGKGFNECVINIGAESMQGCTSFFEFFRTGDFSACKTAAETDLDTLATGAHGALDSSLGSTAVVDTRFNLFGDLFAYNIGVEFGLTDFKDIDLNVFSGQYFELFFDKVNLFTTFTDNDTGAAGMDGYGNAFHRAFDHNTSDTVLHRLIAITGVGLGCFRATGTEVVADFFVLHYFKSVVFVGEPVGVPAPDDS